MNQAPALSRAREASVSSSARNVRPGAAESGRMEDVVGSEEISRQLTSDRWASANWQ